MDDEAKLSAVKAEIGANLDDWTDILQRAANSLLVAHGGAMLACLSQLKDYGSNPQLKHIGFIIAAFAVGFVIATLGYINVAMGPHKAQTRGFSGRRGGLEGNARSARCDAPVRFRGDLAFRRSCGRLALLVALNGSLGHGPESDFRYIYRMKLGYSDAMRADKAMEGIVGNRP